jgi:hypothetical protein
VEAKFRYGVIWGLQVLAKRIRFRSIPLNGSCLDFRFSLGVACELGFRVRGKLTV